jgi:tRNA threonylcarbamoyladenosine biosynthesis protein TsaE
LAQGWGSLDAVSSPTFVLVNVYRRPEGAELFHLDTYRIESDPEAEELDLDTMLAEGALVIEWADRVKTILPEEKLWLKLEYIDEFQRQVTFSASGKRYEQMIVELKRELFGH